MHQEIFADAIGGVHVSGNLVRIDFLSLQPQMKSDNGQPVVEICKRVIMPLEGFIQSLKVQEDMVKKLVDAGVLQKQDKEEKVG